ncbi:MAG: hypothetical protein LBR61_07805 [Synergistaceae bacterium]|jgi:hypothetical protein|nr:hypothetical protein [Synergistaceae bacterium]
MNDKGEIVSSYTIDENLELQIWTKGLSPRLVVFNKNQNKRKLIPLRWLEDRDRKLSVKGKARGASEEYTLADLLSPLQRILAEYAVYTPFRAVHWRFSMVLEKALHTPVTVLNKSEFSMLAEDKRARLWLSDLTDENREKGTGFFRPFFPVSEGELRAFPKPEEGEGAEPSAPKIPFTENRCSTEDLLRTGVVRALDGLNIRRWYRPVRIMAAAMLLGFSFCEEDGSEFCDEIWHAANDNKPLDLKIGDPRLKGLGRKFTGYARHMDVLDKISVWASMDSEKELLDGGYGRKRRIDFPMGFLGDVDSVVTFFDREDGHMALACKPKVQRATGGSGGLFYASPPQKSQEKQELIYTFPQEVYEKALADDAFGGANDDYFTVLQLTSAKVFEAWCETLTPYIAWFTGI